TLTLVIVEAREKVPIHRALQVWMQVGFRLFDGQKGVIALVLVDLPLQLQRLERQEHDVSRAETRIRNRAATLINEKPDVSINARDVSRSEAEARLHILLRPAHRDKKLA